MVAATGNPPPLTGRHPHLRSNSSPPGTLVRDVQGMARPHVPPPPPVLDELNILSDNEGSSPLLLDPDDVDFQVVAAGCRQRVTPLQDASPTMAETSPPTSGNGFGALADTDDSPPWAYDAPGEQATNSDDALYKAVRASQPDITAILLRKDNIINATTTQMTMALNSLVDRMEAMEDRLLAKIDAFNGQFGNLRHDVNNHNKRLTNLSSNLRKQESLLKGYKDKNNKLVVTLHTDVNNARAKIPTLRRELPPLVWQHPLRKLRPSFRTYGLRWPPYPRSTKAQNHPLPPLWGVSVDLPPMPGATRFQLPGGLMPTFRGSDSFPPGNCSPHDACSPPAIDSPHGGHATDGSPPTATPSPMSPLPMPRTHGTFRQDPSAVDLASLNGRNPPPVDQHVGLNTPACTGAPKDSSDKCNVGGGVTLPCPSDKERLA